MGDYRWRERCYCGAEIEVPYYQPHGFPPDEIAQFRELHDHDDTPGATPATPPADCDHCYGGGCMSPTHRGHGNACCVCGDWLPDAPAVTDARHELTTSHREGQA